MVIGQLFHAKVNDIDETDPSCIKASLLRVGNS